MPRPDPYLITHKTLRAMLYDFATQLGRVDAANDTECAEIAARAWKTIGFIHDHGRIEDEHLHARLAERDPEAEAELAREHEQVDASLAEVDGLLEAFQTARGAVRGQLLAQLYNKWNWYVGEYLRHLHTEDSRGLEAIRRNFTDDEILAIQGQIQASIEPGRRMEWMCVMIPCLSSAECALMLAGVQASSPPEVVTAVQALGAELLGADAWEMVEEQARGQDHARQPQNRG